MKMRFSPLAVAVLVQLWALEVSAQEASPSPSPSPSPTATPPGTDPNPPYPTPHPDAATNSGLWDAFNAWAIYLEDIILGLLPSTPEWLKLSTLVTTLHGSFPMAPWYLLHQVMAAFTFVIGAVLIYKVIKLFWI